MVPGVGVECEPQGLAIVMQREVRLALHFHGLGVCSVHLGQQYGIGVRWNAPHNSFIQVGAELGVPGLVLFVGMIASTFVALRRLVRRRPAPIEASPASRALIQALTASLIGFVVGAFFLSLAYSEILYTLVALTVGLQKVEQIRQQPAAAGRG